jgi:adenine-specific DNA-methyltransferase
MPSKKQKIKKIALESYDHPKESRVNNPPVGLVTSQTDRLDGRKTYEYDPHIDPSLQWAGKAERMSFEVPNISLHTHERIDSKSIAQSFMKTEGAPHQPSLFSDRENNPPLSKAVHFYSHEESWANRLIAGDSLLVMNSLLYKEGMAGKVQMIFIDPPYGIRYNSNFQPFVNETQVKDNNDADIPAEPEMIQAFRDTWELGIHSYLTHLRNRLLLAKELLHESGSCFVQISDENVHHAKELMSEIFGPNNFISLVTFKKKNMPLGSKLLEQMDDYIIWYAKDKEKIKYRKIFTPMSVEGDAHWNYVELSDGTIKKLSSDEINNHKLLPKNSELFRFGAMFAAGVNASGFYDVEFNGDIYRYPAGKGWKTPEESMKKLIKIKRVIPWEKGKTLGYKIKLSDYPVTPIDSYWDDTALLSNKIYVVQTSTVAIQKCLLMTTDPGDLVFDPTCGSGTTAFVAEQWGRRWITCDTSRVAIALAKQRLMTAVFDYYQLAHPDEGIRSGFKYKSVPHITLGSIANNEPPTEEILYDKPTIEKNSVRCTGPFTVEAVPSVRTIPLDGKLPLALAAPDVAKRGSTALYQHWIEELKSTGVRAIGGEVIEFARVGHKEGSPFIQAEGDVNKNGNLKKANIVFGSEFGPLEQRSVELAVKATMEEKDRAAYLIFAAFQFDPEAAKDIDQIDLPGIKVLKAQMNIDLLTEDLRKKRSSNQSYWLLGQPAVEITKAKDSRYQVRVGGFDYYNPASGETENGGVNKIAMWMLDTDYDERSVLPTQVFFPQGDNKRDWTRLAKALNGTVDENLLEFFVSDTSLPFSVGKNRKIAVKIIDNRGIESLVIEQLK